MKSFTLKILLIYLFLTILFLFSLLLVNLIPSSVIKNNVGKTLNTFNKEGTYPSYGLPGRQIVLDNYTDPLMLNTAYSIDHRTPLQSALTNRRYENIPDRTDQIANLEVLYSTSPDSQVGYERYWHGYLVYLRPMLTLTDYTGIRFINTLLLYICFAVFTFLSFKKLGKKFTFAFVAGLLFVDFFYLGKSLQYSSVFIIGLLSSIYLLTNYTLPGQPYAIFFIIGGLTAFFDLLTAPLVALGMPLVVFLALHKTTIKTLIILCLFWSFGYLLLWFTKWFMVELLFIPGAIQISLDQIINRTVSTADHNFSHLNALKLNIFQLIGYSRISQLVVVAFIACMILITLRYYRFRKQSHSVITAWMFIALIPYAWYLIAANHSYIHVLYTYRAQFMTVVALLIILFECIDWKRVKTDTNAVRLQLTSQSR